MSASATIAPPKWDLDRHPVLDIRGGSAAERSITLNEIGDQFISSGGTVRCIDPTGQGIRPLTNVAAATTTLHGGLSTLFDALEIATAEPDAHHLVIVDRAELLLRDGGCTANEFDVTLALLIGEAERTHVRVVIAVAGDLSRLAPVTHFALRNASKFRLPNPETAERPSALLDRVS